ncbi:MAG: metal ABC transporter permease [Candidatus Yonathbacteria bacterium CG10_big_fil_rev_8_21_14_0_10_43_136]|uniref:Metal ABC transporter permease n=1 Tax=Candidatus Yonathbacteria bacterium CG_4_10_14_0_8_um_filter_43_17 TaxID=1975099 RepID=A0A2M7Q6D1_9BACT|nr:MAG: metal ABC transporter permease [Candidatus Yonathbacteria bacterium CG10_big_fil_rev_8_21_14_0_10_43_136]PIX57448.1 MAG: metal ABC transporter permease [Candidatus Yonathbacteria bacterium CG_4_10_14_3_um_filter_43_12]PIY58749.1 MAG: metal ABC transporter permease [Candidatus Yonathbacteria bacterium CG_4_10_14_0_8_um_filter_43_17]PJC21702.1 MAG: metal ABC transporter permease [Candidatus Yonathbacteria bacterium CG_4_9_14_0_2_um_filter_43_16]
MLDIFQYDFMIRAFEAGIAIGIVAPLIGMFLVVRRYSLMADTLAHVSFAGVAIGLLLKINPIFSAIGLSVIAGFGIEYLRNSRRIFGESVLAIFLSGSLAIAVIILSLAKGFNANLFSYLFGSISTVTATDLVVIITLATIVFIDVVFLYKELFFTSFDTELAEASGLPVKMINLTMVTLAAVAVAISIRIVGVLLIGALMVIPVISAMQYGRGFRFTLILSVIFSIVSVILGLFASYYYNLASGGAIVVVALIIFLLSLVFVGEGT